MTPISTKIIFFGTEDFSLTALTGLIEAGYDIAAVVTKPDTKRGRGQVLTPPAVKVLAERHNIPVWQPARLLDIADAIRALQPVAGVLASFGKIVPQDLLDLFTPAIINIHPSLLPKYRGPSPIESAILNGDHETGVSIMQLVRAMDAGPIYAQTISPLTGRETQPELYHTLAIHGTTLLVETLPRILDGSLTPTPQRASEATFSQLLTKADAFLTASLSSSEAERRVRAYLTYPKARIMHGDAQLIITKAHISPIKNTPLDLQCSDGVFLIIDELISPSGRRMDAEAYLRGHLA